MFGTQGTVQTAGGDIRVPSMHIARDLHRRVEVRDDVPQIREAGKHGEFDGEADPKMPL